MPTPSDILKESPRRSIFGNYRTGQGTPSSSSACDEGNTFKADREAGAPSLQNSMDQAIARSFIYRFLAKGFEDGAEESWCWLTNDQTKRSLALALESLGQSCHLIQDGFASDTCEEFAFAYITCFGHTVRGDCPMNEIEYGDIKADPLFQPHRLSDLGAFYAAFGLEVTSDAAERIDHISIELEFMSVLAVKEAYALEHQFDAEQIAVLRDAQKKFLREHLGRWSPAFARRLARMAEGTPLAALARLLGEFIKLDCSRLKVPQGSEDLLLRPVDDAAERLCEGCGIHALPPGAATAGPKL